jgi:hypothetical protein
MTEMDQITPVPDLTLSWLRCEPVRRIAARRAHASRFPRADGGGQTQRPEGYF